MLALDGYAKLLAAASITSMTFPLPLQEWKAEAARRGKPYLLTMAMAAYTPNLVGA